jgi:hypothetical protein
MRLREMNIPAIIDAENIDDVLALRQWLHDAITRIEHEHTQLTQFLTTIEQILNKPAPHETQTPIERLPDQVKQCFAPNLHNRLDFTHDDAMIRIRPRQYLDRTIWQAITTIIHQLNGYWRPVGAESYWTIPLQKPR